MLSNLLRRTLVVLYAINRSQCDFNTMLIITFCSTLIFAVIRVDNCRAVKPGSRSGPQTWRSSFEGDTDGHSVDEERTAAMDVVAMWSEALSTTLTELANKALRHDELQQLYDSGVGCSSTMTSSQEDDFNITDHVSSTAHALGKVTPHSGCE